MINRLKPLRVIFVTTCLCSVTLLIGCSNEQVSAQSLNSPNIRNISAIEANEIISNDNAVSVIDVRTPQEFSGGHIRNATNIDFYSPNFTQAIATLPKDKTYLLYCRSGNRSGQAMRIFKENGFEKVYNVSGGISAWTNQGLPK